MSTIKLVDLDGVDLVHEIERSFGIQIKDGEADDCRTVGDLIALVERKVAFVERGALPCPTASAFHEIRRCLRAANVTYNVAPATRLSDLVNASTPRSWNSAWAQSGLFIPPVYLRRSKLLSMLLRVIFAVVLEFALLRTGAHGWSIVVVGLTWFAFELLWASVRMTETVMGLDRDATVGDLARVIAALNARRLAANGTGVMRRRDLQSAVEGVIRYVTGFGGPIDKRSSFKPVGFYGD